MASHDLPSNTPRRTPRSARRTQMRQRVVYAVITILIVLLYFYFSNPQLQNKELDIPIQNQVPSKPSAVSKDSLNFKAKVEDPIDQKVQKTLKSVQNEKIIGANQGNLHDQSIADSKKEQFVDTVVPEIEILAPVTDIPETVSKTPEESTIDPTLFEIELKKNGWVKEILEVGDGVHKQIGRAHV